MRLEESSYLRAIESSRVARYYYAIIVKLPSLGTYESSQKPVRRSSGFPLAYGHVNNCAIQ